MEYVQTVLVRIAANKFDAASAPGGLLSDLEGHRAYLSTQPGSQGMQITRSANPEGDVLVVVETRWSNNNAMADYSSQEPNVASIVNQHGDEIIRDSVQVHRMETEKAPSRDAPNRVYDRLALAVLIPLGVLALAVLVIYGLSRIYLVLPGSWATPLAAGIAIAVLAVSAYFATHPFVPRWQIAGLFVVLLAFGIGGIAASVYDDQTAEKKHVEATPVVPPPTPANGGPTAVPGLPEIDMGDNFFQDAQGDKNPTITVTGAGKDIVLQIHNKGTAIHNVHVAASGSYTVAVCKATGDAPCSKPAAVPGGQDGTISFNLPAGTYDFRCDFHPDQMSGKIDLK